MPQFTPKHDHERTDAKVRPLAYFLISMFFLVVCSYLVTSLLFEFFTQRVESKTSAAEPLQIQNEEPPEPRLQVVPGLDLSIIRAEADEKLGGYGWVDEGQRIVRIPIDKAIEMVVEQAGGDVSPAAEEAGDESSSEESSEH